MGNVRRDMEGEEKQGRDRVIKKKRGRASGRERGMEGVGNEVRGNGDKK